MNNFTEKREALRLAKLEAEAEKKNFINDMITRKMEQLTKKAGLTEEQAEMIRFTFEAMLGSVDRANELIA
jgi:hypothetical protein